MATQQGGKPAPDASWDEHYADEKDAAWLYRELARAERNADRRDLFTRLAIVEDRHTTRWEELFREAGFSRIRFYLGSLRLPFAIAKFFDYRSAAIK